MKKWIAVLMALFLPITSFAAVQVVVLGVIDSGSNNVSYNYLCWLTVANPIAAPNFVSAWKPSGSSAGPNAGQISALQAGTTLERQFSVTFASSTPIATVESALISGCNNQQSYLNGLPGPGTFYGQTWNGTTWAPQ